MSECLGLVCLTKFLLGEVTQVGCVRQSHVSQLGKLLGNILHDEDAKRVRAKGGLECLEGDVAYGGEPCK